METEPDRGYVVRVVWRWISLAGVMVAVAFAIAIPLAISSGASPPSQSPPPCPGQRETCTVRVGGAQTVPAGQDGRYNILQGFTAVGKGGRRR
jgi:hypothetical protein